MTRNRLFSLLCAIFVWILGVSVYLLSFFIPFLENPELQANIVLATCMIPLACLGTYLFYRNAYLKPAALALTFVVVAALLDAFITVPVFVMPAGGSYSGFFSDPMFYAIVVEYYLVVLYFGNHITKKTQQ